MQETSTNTQITPGKGIFFSMTPREFIFKYLKYLPYILLSVFGALIFTFVRLRYAERIFNVEGTILVKDPNPYQSSSDKFGDIFMMQPSRNLFDEIQIVRSTNIARRVVKNLGLQISYYNEGKVRTTQLYAKQSPIEIVILKLNDTTSGFSIPVKILSETEFTMSEDGAGIPFSKLIELKYGLFMIRRTKVPLENFSSTEFFINWSPLEAVARGLAGSLKVVQVGDGGNILRLSMETPNPLLGVDIVNEWMEQYQKSGLDDKRQIAVSALTFIDAQLDTARRELSRVESSLQGFREQNQIIDPELQMEMSISRMSDVENQYTEQAVKIKVVENMIRYISESANEYKIVPSSLGIIEPSLNVQITDFNSLQVQRETLLKTTTATNPMVKNIDAAISKLRQDILQNLRNIKSSYEVLAGDLKAKSDNATRKVSSIPGKQKMLLDITRRQKIQEELYSYLLKKRLETSIGSASTISSVRVVEQATSSSVPIKPNGRSMYTLALLAGLALPLLLIILKDWLNDKIQLKSDVQKNTSAPIIGEVNHSESKDVLVATRNSRRLIAEQFRLIRTNLQYVLPRQEKPVILVTSSTSGEGKSFVSVNMGAVMALAGKRTVIMEFDIRKPKVVQNLGLSRSAGITNFLIGKASFRDLPIQVSAIENLYVIGCGPIPPNPAELLLETAKLDDLFARAKEEFDVIIIDTAPVGLVSDSFQLGRYADATLFILRHNFTNKKQTTVVEELYQSGRLPKMNLVINDIRATGSYGYYNYNGYGSGYTYGENEYFQGEREVPSFSLETFNIFKRFRKRK